MLPVENILLLTILLDQQTGRPEVMPRQAREEMVCDLEVQTAVKELDLRRADDIHGSSKLTRGERLGWTEILGRAGKMGEDDLDQLRNSQSSPVRGLDWPRHG